MARSFVYGAVTRHTAILSRFGLQAGFFARAGIDLQVRTVFGGPEMAAAVESGEVHVGEVGTPPGLTAIGAGRRIMSDEISPAAGIVIYRHRGETVERGEPLCGVVERRAGVKVDPGELRTCFTIGETAPDDAPMILEHRS